MSKERLQPWGSVGSGSKCRDAAVVVKAVGAAHSFDGRSLSVEPRHGADPGAAREEAGGRAGGHAGENAGENAGGDERHRDVVAGEHRRLGRVDGGDGDDGAALGGDGVDGRGAGLLARAHGHHAARGRRLRHEQRALRDDPRGLACAECNRWFGWSRPNSRLLELGHVDVDSAEFWTNRWLSSSARSTAEEHSSTLSRTLTVKSNGRCEFGTGPRGA